MTAKELIERLQKFPPEANVYIKSGNISKRIDMVDGTDYYPDVMIVSKA